MNKFFKCKNPEARLVEVRYEDMLVRHYEGCSAEDQRACHVNIHICPLYHRKETIINTGIDKELWKLWVAHEYPELCETAKQE